MAVSKRGDKLVIDFRCYLPNGRRKRCVEFEGPDNKGNRKRVNSKWKSIEYHLKHGDFKYLDFFPYGSKAKYFSPQSESMLFSEWWEIWLSEKSLRQNTARNWASAYKIHIGPHFGHLPIDKITEHDVLFFRKVLQEKGLAHSTINDKIIKPLRMALYRAEKRGVIAEYPCDEILRLKEAPPTMDPFSFEELEQLLKTAAEKIPNYFYMIAIWAKTGLRPGEVCALKWTCLDKFNRKLLIRETRHSNGTDGPPKTEHSIRDIDLSEETLWLFKRQEQLTGLNPYIFINDGNGKPWITHYLQDLFKRLCRLAGLKYRQPMQMRHTFATLHIGAGENITWVSEMLGHASVAVTLKKYNRFKRNLTRQDGSAFESMVKGHFGKDLVMALGN